MISLPLFALSVVCYAISQMQQHGVLRWRGNPESFWGVESWVRKYKKNRIEATGWYAKLFKIKYKERFPLSATLLVFLTDGYHFTQMIFKITLCLSIVFYSPVISLVVDSVLYWLLFGIVFTLSYKTLSS